MTRSGKKDTSILREELRRFELLVSGGNYDAELHLPLPEFRRLLEMAGDCVHHAEASALEIERLKTQLAEMNRSLDLATRIDPMTGLANRRDIVGKIEQEHSRAKRHQRTYSIIMADIDDFRQVNDTYGINSGDDVLFELSCVLRECVRNEDICARWGGEEFLFLLPETGLDGALAVAHKINQSVAMTEFKVNRPGIRITVSLGVAEYHAGHTVNDCLKKVEQAMLSAKQAGKNRYVVAG
jgi:diguanylate cyclase (GGDEF)-like protein